MRRQKYPLEPLARLKKDRVDEKARILAAAIAERETRENDRRRKEADREAARASADAVRIAERNALEQGNLRVQDLARANLWETRVKDEDAQRRREIGEAGSAVERARAGESSAKSEVASARAESESVERHRSRWRSVVKGAEEAREEEDMADAVRPKRVP
jgi:hypothetical protein